MDERWEGRVKGIEYIRLEPTSSSSSSPPFLGRLIHDSSVILSVREWPHFSPAGEEETYFSSLFPTSRVNIISTAYYLYLLTYILMYTLSV